MIWGENVSFLYPPGEWNWAKEALNSIKEDLLKLEYPDKSNLRKHGKSDLDFDLITNAVLERLRVTLTGYLKVDRHFVNPIDENKKLALKNILKRPDETIQNLSYLIPEVDDWQEQIDNRLSLYKQHKASVPYKKTLIVHLVRFFVVQGILIGTAFRKVSLILNALGKEEYRKLQSNEFKSSLDDYVEKLPASSHTVSKFYYEYQKYPLVPFEDSFA